MRAIGASASRTKLSDSVEDLAFHVKVEEGTLFIALSGDYDMRSGPHIMGIIEQHAEQPIGHIILDCAQLQFADSSFPFMLLRTREIYKEQEPTITLKGCRPHIRWMLRITGVEELLRLEMPEKGLA